MNLDQIIPKIVSRADYDAVVKDRDNLLTKAQGLENEITNLKNMSKDMTEAQAQHNTAITTLKADNEKATNELKANYDKQLADLNASTVALKTEHEKAINDLKTANEAAVTQLKTDYEKQISDYKAKAELAENSSEHKAISTLAKIGLPAEEMPKVDKKGKTLVLDEARKLQGQALSDYFEKHKKAIFEALKNSNKQKE